MRKFNKTKEERGAALVLVLVVVALLSIVGVTFSGQIANRIKSTKTTNEGIQAKYLAETCVENSVNKTYENLYSKLEEKDKEFKSGNEEKVVSRSTTSRVALNDEEEDNILEKRLGYMNNIKFYLSNSASNLEKVIIALDKLDAKNDRLLFSVYDNTISHREEIIRICKTYSSGSIDGIDEKNVLDRDISLITLSETKLLGNDDFLKEYRDKNTSKNEYLDEAFLYTYKGLDEISLALQNMIEYKHTFHIDDDKVEISDGIPNSKQYFELVQNSIIDKSTWTSNWNKLDDMLKTLPNDGGEFNPLRVHLRNNVKEFERLSSNISNSSKNTADNFEEYKKLLYEIASQCNQLKAMSYERMPIGYEYFDLIPIFNNIQNTFLAEIKCKLKELVPQEVDKTEEITIKIPFYKAEYDTTKEDWPKLSENGSGTELKLVVTGDKTGITDIEVKDGKKSIPGLGIEENSSSKYKVEATVNFDVNANSITSEDDIKDKISINHDISLYKKVN